MVGCSSINRRWWLSVYLEVPGARQLSPGCLRRSRTRRAEYGYSEVEPLLPVIEDEYYLEVNISTIRQMSR
tara:strand:+ start:893 stop:1105 length:213 start_codon:yes stop_codon:yes gene_type:complete